MLYERLSDAEKNMIEYYRDSQMESDFVHRNNKADTRYWLRYWESAKKDLAAPFSDSLILKKRVTVAVENNDLIYEMTKVLNSSACFSLKERLSTMLRETEGDNYTYWHEDLNYYNIRSLLYGLFDELAFIKNVYNGPAVEVKCYNNVTVKFVPGQKVMKILGRLAKAEGSKEALEYFETTRLEQSRVMNEAKLSADLCVSIHPLDYMTASLNENNWRSCMCWEDGEYRRGVIEMMNSPMVVVAYLESNTKTLYAGAGNHWNSKKWREFFIVTPNFISGIKGYPYWNKELETKTLEWLRELYSSAWNIEYSNNIKDFSNNNPVADGEAFAAIPHLNIECGPAMYNDFYNGNSFQIILRKYYTPAEGCFIDYSGASECICCGEEEDFEGEGDLLCSDCITYCSCCKCGCVIEYESDLYELNGLYYCRDCYEDLPSCDYCGSVVDVDNDNDAFEFSVGIEDYDNRKIIDVIKKPYNYSRAAGKIVCEDCVNKVFISENEEIYKEHFYYHDYDTWYCSPAVVPITRMTEYGLSIFPKVEVERILNLVKENAN